MLGLSKYSAQSGERIPESAAPIGFKKALIIIILYKFCHVSGKNAQIIFSAKMKFSRQVIARSALPSGKSFGKKHRLLLELCPRT